MTTSKEKLHLKKLTKKQQIYLSIIAGIAAVVAIGGTIFFTQHRVKAADSPEYKTYTIKKADPLIFNGVVDAEQTESFYNDQSKGTLSNILVTEGQEIKAKTAVLAYQSNTAQDQVDEQQQQLEKLNLAVTTAQQNLDNAYAKKQEIENKKGTTSQSASVSGALSNPAEQASDAISAQDDAILQAQQALDAANLDLTTANESLETAKNKVTTNVSSTIDGIAEVNEAGKAAATVPVVKVVSKSTVINAKVSEYDYSRVKKDQAVTIQPVNSDEKIQGTIIEVSRMPENSEGVSSAAAAATGSTMQTSSMATYSFKVKPGKELQYGYSCQISVPVNELRLSSDALVKEDGKQYVYVYKNGAVHKTAVTTVDENGVVVVTAGLKENDKVISNPKKDLQDGKKVTVS